MDCLFCGSSLSPVKRLGDRLAFEVDCPQCGLYSITQRIQSGLMKDQYDQYKHLIAGVIREKNELGIGIDLISIENILNIVNDPLVPKTIGQKLDKILLYYYRRSKVYGQWLSVDERTPSSIGYALNHDELLNMVQALIDTGMFKLITQGGKMKQFTITLSGIGRAEKLLSTNIYSSKVFVAMGFKDDLMEAHRMAIQPACHECGFDASIIIETEHNDDITDKIIAEIKTSKFVITDFTYNNQGAYFEAGYAQGRGLPVIRTCKKEWFDGKDEKGEKNRLHFDINHYNFILWENFEDLKEKLINRIRATII
jgi:nucleoside 2-deoxyribosyltransferase